MQSENLKWLIIRTIGVILLCASVYHLFHLVVHILSLLPADSHCHDAYYGYGELCGKRALEPIYGKIWLTLKELCVFGGMSYYFLKKGTTVFALLLNKETSND